ncbi:MAG: hypothetical protein JWQ06_2273 [Mucilaginibacter sp.]|nr:hypothetical protein [Mucilaginibacter sp.]
MKTLWNEIEQIEAYLHRSADTGSKLVFEARLLLEPELQEKTAWQQKAYEFIHRYGRRQLKQEIEAVHQQLFASPEHASFSQKIRLLFINR